MKDLNICIDIDGTVTDPYYWIEPCNKYFNTSITNDDAKHYNICKTFNISEADYMKFYKENKFQIHWQAKVLPDASVIVNQLSKAHNIYFVTARDESLTLLTRSYLKHHNFNYDELYLLGSHYKVEKAKELNSDVFIEDSYENALMLSEAGFKVLLIDTNYNRFKLNKNITRVHDWDEIYNIINELLLQESTAM